MLFFFYSFILFIYLFICFFIYLFIFFFYFNKHVALRSHDAFLVTFIYFNQGIRFAWDQTWKTAILEPEKLYRRRKSEGGASDRGGGGGEVTKYSLIHGVFRSLCQGLLRTAILNNAKALGTRLRNYLLLPC